MIAADYDDTNILNIIRLFYFLIVLIK